MQGKKKRVIIAIMIFSMLQPCISLNVNASTISTSLETGVIAPSSLLKLSKTTTFSNGVKITVNYTYQESTGRVAAIDKVYISYYPPSKFSSVRIANYTLLNTAFGNIEVETFQKSIGSSREIYQAYYIALR